MYIYFIYCVLAYVVYFLTWRIGTFSDAVHRTGVQEVHFCNEAVAVTNVWLGSVQLSTHKRVGQILHLKETGTDRMCSYFAVVVVVVSSQVCLQ